MAYAKRRQTEMEERVKDLERSLPELELKTGGERPLVVMFEGKEGIQGAIEDVKKSQPKEIYEITDLDALRTIVSSDDQRPFSEALQQIVTQVVGIYGGQPKKPTADVNADQYVLPAERWWFKTHIAIYKNKIVFITFESKMFTVIIENNALANTMRILFELAVSCLPVYKKYFKGQ